MSLSVFRQVASSANAASSSRSCFSAAARRAPTSKRSPACISYRPCASTAVMRAALCSRLGATEWLIGTGPLPRGADGKAGVAARPLVAGQNYVRPVENFAIGFKTPQVLELRRKCVTLPFFQDQGALGLGQEIDQKLICPDQRRHDQTVAAFD
jgi:hypothetical protein